jgi:hypothetical protein
MSTRHLTLNRHTKRRSWLLADIGPSQRNFRLTSRTDQQRISRHVSFVNWQPQESRTSVDEARMNAWLAICGLASETADDENRTVNTDSLWAVAIDRVQAWVTEAV